MIRHDKFLGVAIVAKHLVFQFVPASYVYNHKVKLLFFYSMADFGILQSSVHESWARWRSGKLGSSGMNYSTSASLDTFPLPEWSSENRHRCLVDSEKFYTSRENVRNLQSDGLTGVMNRFQNP